VAIGVPGEPNRFKLEGRASASSSQAQAGPFPATHWVVNAGCKTACPCPRTPVGVIIPHRPVTRTVPSGTGQRRSGAGQGAARGCTHCRDDVGGVERNVLDSGPSVVVNIFLQGKNVTALVTAQTQRAKGWAWLKNMKAKSAQGHREMKKTHYW